MVGYINRREAEQRIADLVNLTRGRCPTWDEVHEALYDLPFVELIRCKDCKHYDGDENSGIGTCLENGVCSTPEWFCADWERKE